jgi:lauroyl/myristoyl acyltransferase
MGAGLRAVPARADRLGQTRRRLAHATGQPGTKSPGLVRSLAQRVSGRLPYGGGVELQVAWSRLQRRLNTREFAALVQGFRALLPLETDARRLEDLALSARVCGSFTGWRMRMLLNLPPDRLERVVHVRGLQVLETLRDSGQGGVVVLSKFGAGVAVPLILSRLGCPLWSVEAGDHVAMAGLPVVPGLSVLEWKTDDPALRELRILRATRRLLEGHSIVCMPGDGDARAALRAIAMPFLGRARRFPTGFAYLSVITGSPAVPVFSTLSRSGRIDIEILPPLHPRPDDVTTEEKAQSVLRAYVELLEERWRTSPGNVLPGQIRRYIELPPAADMPAS